jgi:catechol 2,3-dioxygenase-like lactoylglutathione lyase family enzyme
MQLLNDIHHLTFVTRDMDRLIAFYAAVFDAPVIADMAEEGLRHVFIQVGPHTTLHAFQIPGVEPPGPQPMFERGRLDHFSLQAASEEAFRELYRRAVAAGACDGEVTDMVALIQFSFDDPDGARHEVSWNKPGVPFAQGGERANWKRVEMS